MGVLPGEPTHHGESEVRLVSTLDVGNMLWKKMLTHLEGEFVLAKFVQHSTAAYVLILNICTQPTSQHMPIVILTMMKALK